MSSLVMVGSTVVALELIKAPVGDVVGPALLVWWSDGLIRRFVPDGPSSWFLRILRRRRSGERLPVAHQLKSVR